ncbi:MAG: hypothetical protein NTV94_01405 [Planctomycetota bacterium]|nr:hypothetical protein [Planctomycetota bacterium]
MKTPARVWAPTLLACTVLGACATQQASSSVEHPAGTTTPAAATAATAITVDGERIATSTLSAAALEAAGAVVVEEAALDSLLASEMARAGITIGDTQIDHERQLLFERISAEAQVGEEQAGLLIDRFRRARGLGPIRFAAMLRRNAQLRTLVQEQAAGWDESIRQIVNAELGPKALARLIVLASPADAAAIRSQIESLPASERSGQFAKIAVERSRDPSSARGGLFGPVAHSEASVPASIREHLGEPAGSLSPVVAIDSGMAIVLIEEQIAPAPATDAGAAIATRKARSRLEREAMDKLASQLLAQARINVLDNAARWSWDNRLR